MATQLSHYIVATGKDHSDPDEGQVLVWFETHTSGFATAARSFSLNPFRGWDALDRNNMFM
jgi:hypothetical protein